MFHRQLPATFHVAKLLMLAIVVVALSIAAAPSRAAPVGFGLSTIDTASPNAAFAYAPDGTRYVVEGVPFNGQSNKLKTVLPNGTVGPTIDVSGTLFRSVGGAAWDHLTGQVLVTDNYPGTGTLVSINPATGSATTIVSGLASIDDVAVRSTGEVFVSTADGGGLGAVYTVNRQGGALTPVLGNLEFGAGLAFETTGNLIVQESYFVDVVNGITKGRLFRLPLSGAPGNLDVGTPTMLLDNMDASFDVAVDSDNDIFVSGSGGLVRIDGDTRSVTSFDTNGNPFQFATELAFFPGGGDFEPLAGPSGGRLTYIPEFNSRLLVDITPVPEPSTVLLLAAGGLAIGVLGRRRRPR